jgi:hypothetical protein
MGLESVNYNPLYMHFSLLYITLLPPWLRLASSTIDVLISTFPPFVSFGLPTILQGDLFAYIDVCN